MHYDIVIHNGRVIDGTGNPWFNADIGIRGGKIRKIGKIENRESEQAIDAQGMVVSPGFIDLHNHSDMTAQALPGCESNLMQGVTTAVVGNCGLSMAPISPKTRALLKEYLSPFLVGGFDYGWGWKTFKDFFLLLKERNIAINMAPLVGHGTLRIAVSGFKKEPLSDPEMAEMKNLLRKSLKAGAFGMSTGLIYPPGCYASTEELIELSSVLKEFGRIYTSHIRDEGADLIESVAEAVRIGEANGIPVQVSHLKAKGAANWGKVRTAIRMMEEARRRGVDIGFEAYPYLAGSTTITSILPIWAMEGGVAKMLDRLRQAESREKIRKQLEDDGNDIKDAGWNGIIIASCPKRQDLEGNSLEAIIRMMNRTSDPYGGFLDMVLEIEGDSTVVKFFIDEEDVREILSNPLSAVISDSWATAPHAGGKPHPRCYGTFPRMLGKYVREERLVPIEAAVQKMTALPAAKIGLYDRGILRKGLWADVVIFDPEKIADRATFDSPHQYPIGIEYVLVNGKIAVSRGRQSESRSGTVLLAEMD
ncbi:MAG: D-aminoacylase [Desulfobacteraceae bacterium]|nr:MAG: D-aminoacylase [Desulfobacteraceae bacterium]